MCSHGVRHVCALHGWVELGKLWFGPSNRSADQFWTLGGQDEGHVGVEENYYVYLPEYFLKPCFVPTKTRERMSLAVGLNSHCEELDVGPEMCGRMSSLCSFCSFLG